MLSNYRDYLQHNILHVKTRITYPSLKYSGLLLKHEYLVNLFQAICTSPIHCMLFSIQPTPVVRKIFNKWKFYCQSWQIRRWCRWQLKGSSQKVTWYFFSTHLQAVWHYVNTPSGTLYTDKFLQVLPDTLSAEWVSALQGQQISISGWWLLYSTCLVQMGNRREATTVTHHTAYPQHRSRGEQEKQSLLH